MKVEHITEGSIISLENNFYSNISASWDVFFLQFQLLVFYFLIH